MNSKGVKELVIENYIVGYAKERRFLVHKLNNSASDGWPDRLFVSPTGDHIYIEFKRKGEKLRPLQEYRINELCVRKCVVYVVDNREDGKHVIQYHQGNMDSEAISRKVRRNYDKTVRSGITS